MDYGGCDRRTTKKDLRRKRRVRVYKRGGPDRTSNFSSVDKKEAKK